MVIRGNLWLAVLLAPLSLILILVVCLPVTLFFETVGFVETVVSLGILAAYAVPIAYLATFFIGLPVHYCLTKIGRAHPRTYASVGCIVGLVSGLAFFSDFLNTLIGWIYVPLFAVSGTIVALTFGILAVDPKGEVGVT